MLMFIDGGIVFNQDKKKGVIASGFAILNDNAEVISQGISIQNEGTTPEAEYTALLNGLKKIDELKLKGITIFSDSQLIVYQIQGKYSVYSENLKRLFNECKSLMQLTNSNLFWVKREENSYVDGLVKASLIPYRRKKCSQ